MAEKLTIYQKPTCSKCRETMAILKEEGVSFDAIDYFIDPLDAATIRSLLEKLHLPAMAIVRKNEPAYRELEMSDTMSEEEIVTLLSNHPELVQRPIVVRGDSAVIARPPENVRELF